MTFKFNATCLALLMFLVIPQLDQTFVPKLMVTLSWTIGPWPSLSPCIYYFLSLHLLLQWWGRFLLQAYFSIYSWTASNHRIKLRAVELNLSKGYQKYASIMSFSVNQLADLLHKRLSSGFGPQYIIAIFVPFIIFNSNYNWTFLFTITFKIIWLFIVIVWIPNFKKVQGFVLFHNPHDSRYNVSVMYRPANSTRNI